MVEITAAPDDGEDYDPPSGSEPGRILIEILSVDDYAGHGYRYEIDGSTHEGGGAFWVNEGVGIKYFADQYLDLELPGWYVVEGVTVGWSRDYWGEVDEDIDFTIVRRASPEEIDDAR